MPSSMSSPWPGQAITAPSMSCDLGVHIAVSLGRNRGPQIEGFLLSSHAHSLARDALQEPTPMPAIKGQGRLRRKTSGRLDRVVVTQLDMTQITDMS
jgi:hypothetical protein